MNSSLMRAALVLLFAGSAVLMGCAGDDGADIDVDTTLTDTTGMLGTGETEQRAIAQLAPTEGNSVVGSATFTSTNGSVRVEATVSGLAPGKHGFHVHENGDCSAPDASSAGGHFAPQDNPHAGPDDQPRHVGDLGNLEAGEDSTAEYSRDDSVISLSGPNSIVGKALVVHSGEDDLETQPSGDSGDRVACGVIEMETGGGAMERGAGIGEDTTAAIY